MRAAWAGFTPSIRFEDTATPDRAELVGYHGNVSPLRSVLRILQLHSGCTLRLSAGVSPLRSVLRILQQRSAAGQTHGRQVSPLRSVLRILQLQAVAVREHPILRFTPSIRFEDTATKPVFGGARHSLSFTPSIRFEDTATRLPAGQRCPAGS